MRRLTWIAAPLVGAIGSLAACDGADSSSTAPKIPSSAMTPDGGGGDAQANPDVVAPPGCDLTKSPKESPECVSNSVGVFVSPTGKDGAAGTKEEPLKSIAEAVTRGLPRVYVCEGNYDAPVTITSPIAIFGGLSCAWAPSDARPMLAPKKGVALKVTKVLGAVLLEDIDISGNADPDSPSDSAIAALVSESDNVTLRRVNLTAGPGTAGSKGGTKSNFTGVAKNGANAMAASGGGETTCSCADGTTSSKGGRGGTVGAGALDPTPGAATPPVGGINSGNNGGPNCIPGTVGAAGLATTGGTGSTTPGTLTADGWNASAAGGGAGGAGNPGQGGGGGGGRGDISSGGGGGGCGGCGGGGGEPGANGGSSIALLSFKSTISVETGALRADRGGRGGEGGPGQNGQAPGNGGPGACGGGGGGAGAGGAGGGGGAGGHSIPIVFVGTEPKVVGTTLTPGEKGLAGQGGARGEGPGNAGSTGDPGTDGKSQNTFAL